MKFLGCEVKLVSQRRSWGYLDDGSTNRSKREGVSGGEEAAVSRCLQHPCNILRTSVEQYSKDWIFSTLPTSLSPGCLHAYLGFYPNRHASTLRSKSSLGLNMGAVLFLQQKKTPMSVLHNM